MEAMKLDVDADVLRSEGFDGKRVWQRDCQQLGERHHYCPLGLDPAGALVGASEQNPTSWTKRLPS